MAKKKPATPATNKPQETSQNKSNAPRELSRELTGNITGTETDSQTDRPDSKPDSGLGSETADDTSTTIDSAGNAGDAQATQSDAQINGGNAGDDRFLVADPAEIHQNDGLACEETRAQASNRWVREGRRWETDTFRKDVIRQCRARGMTKEEASDHAWKACFAQFPPPGIEPTEPEMSPIGDKTAEPPAKPSPATAPPDDPISSGISDIPSSWPELPANAQLQVEIAWVSANRLRVRSGSGVDLSRALSPAPSYSALSWLETSILFPSKFADISVKASADQDDEKEFIRREKLAVEEIRGILKEMLDAKT